jgi:hypothetical protein
LLKVGFGTLFVRTKRSMIELEAGVPTALEYPASLKIRGFAIKGGARPGYRFEPSEREGSYRLTIFAAGEHELLISAITRSGHTVIDRLHAIVHLGPHALAPLEPPVYQRDEAKVRAWPQPDPIPVDYERVLDEELPREDSSTMSPSERIALQQKDRLEKDSDEDVMFLDAEEPPVEEDLTLLDPSDSISRAEASLLKLAVVLNTDDDDLK